MSALTTPDLDAGRRSSSSSRRAGLSHGRGGAGNVHPATTVDAEPEDLTTPTIKSEFYTTGRGGTGNIAQNTDPEQARRAQDVEGHPRPESDSRTHVGRGGAANVFHPSQAEIEAAKRDNERWESAGRDDVQTTKVKGLADKGKDWLFGLKGGRA